MTCAFPSSAAVASVAPQAAVAAASATPVTADLIRMVARENSAFTRRVWGKMKTVVKIG